MDSVKQAGAAPQETTSSSLVAESVPSSFPESSSGSSFSFSLLSQNPDEMDADIEY
jgi:hypothetical protein